MLEAARDLLRAVASAWPAVWRTTLLAWVPQTVIWYVVVSVYPGPVLEEVFASLVWTVVLALVIGPVVETMLQALVLWALRRCLADSPRVVWYSALFFGALHFPSSTWGLHAIWAFYVFSRLYLVQSKHSTWRAIWMTTLVHSGCNLLSYIGTLIWRSMG